MEIKEIQGFILLLIFVGMLLGVGVLVIDKYGRAARDTTTVIDSGNNLSTGSSVSLGQTYCLEILSVSNKTVSYNLDTYNVTLSDPDGCVMSYSPIAACGKAARLCNITYTYGKTTTAATAAINTNAAITPISSTWLPLVVTVFVLAIILSLVISSFAGGGRK